MCLKRSNYFVLTEVGKMTRNGPQKSRSEADFLSQISMRFQSLNVDLPYCVWYLFLRLETVRFPEAKADNFPDGFSFHKIGE